MNANRFLLLLLAPIGFLVLGVCLILVVDEIPWKETFPSVYLAGITIGVIALFFSLHEIVRQARENAGEAINAAARAKERAAIILLQKLKAQADSPTNEAERISDEVHHRPVET